MFHKVMKLNIHKIGFQNIYQACCCYTSRSKKYLQPYSFFQQELDLSDHQIMRIFYKNPSFHKDSYASLCENLSQLLDFGISKEDVINKIKILTMHPVTVKNYVMLLEEGGFIKSKIKAETIISFKNISKMPIKLLKEQSYIHEHINVEHHILSFIQFPKELYPNSFDESCEWNTVQQSIYKLYIEKKIEMSSEKINIAQHVYKRLFNKSFRLLEKNINILLHELNFSEEKIRRHSYLLYCDPDNIIAILDKFKCLCGMETKKLLGKHPKILLTRWKTIEQINTHFKDFGISESVLIRAPEILTLGSNSVYKRLCKIKDTPVLASFMPNPQLALLVYYFNKANSRLENLQNKNCVSLNLLITNDFAYNRFHRLGADQMRANNKMLYLVNELGEDKNKLRTLLERHPNWKHISLLSIRQTYEYLKQKNCTKDQLRQCPQICLYPVPKIENAWEISQNMENVSYLRDLSGSIKSTYILSLILYNIEKDCHFNGDGVWYEENNNTLLSNSSNVPTEDTEELDHEPSNRLCL